LKCVENASEESCDGDSVHVILRTRGGGSDLSTGARAFENTLHSNRRWRAVCIAFSEQLQFGEGVLFILWSYEWKLP
jgi:hypothetical protein